MKQRYFLILLFGLIIGIFYHSILIKSNNVIDETQTKDSVYLKNEFNDNTCGDVSKIKSPDTSISFKAFENIDSVIVDFTAPIPPYQFQMKFTKQGVFIKDKEDFFNINYANQLTTLLDQLYISKTKRIILERKKTKSMIIANNRHIYISIYYDNADYKTISMIYGKYQGDYEITYSEEFNEFIRLLKLCAFELNA